MENMYNCSLIKLGTYELEVDLVPLNIQDFDVILGIDWLVCHHVIVDYFLKEVIFHFYVISAIVARQFL